MKRGRRGVSLAAACPALRRAADTFDRAARAAYGKIPYRTAEGDRLLSLVMENPGGGMERGRRRPGRIGSGERFGVRNIRVFGSVARGEATSGSDLGPAGRR